MKTFAKYVFILSCMFLFAASGYAADFSADMVSSSPQGTFTMKFYISGEKSRMEMDQAVTISRMDKKVVWVLMPEQKMYMEQPIDPRSAASTQEKIEGEIDRKIEGKEVINGINTTKYLVTFETGGKSESVYQWIDEASHIPVKTSAIDGSWSNEFRNIQSGAQKDDLFEIPDGYQKMSFGM